MLSCQSKSSTPKLRPLTAELDLGVVQHVLEVLRSGPWAQPLFVQIHVYVVYSISMFVISIIIIMIIIIVYTYVYT